MNRYFFYLLVVNMLGNIFLHVPTILIQNRYEGTVLGILIGTIIGSIFLFVFTVSLNKFPGMDIAEILEKTPKWFRLLFLLFFSMMWFLAGVLTLLAFNNVTIRFVNPDISGLNMISIFAISIIIIIARLKSEKILYTVEILLLINIPFLLLILTQAFLHDYLTIDAMIEIGTHFKKLPSWDVLSATTYTFSGYANMVLFNRVFKDKIKVRTLWFIPILGFVNLCITFFIPIGFWGTEAVGDLTFPWVSTADALKIEFGPIERLITVFILMYVSLSIISVIVHWHVAFEILKKVLKTGNIKDKQRTILEWSILFCFGLIVYIVENNFREANIFEFGAMWLNIRFPSEGLLVALMFFMARRAAK
ncbi:GerAB/ArcD/ProY family transporter [Bacillus sp. AK128]